MIEEEEYFKYLQEEERKNQRAKEVVVQRMLDEVKKVIERKGYVFWEENTYAR